MKLVVEIKDKRGTRLERMEINSGAAIEIGRAWDNDLIIVDKFVDPNHLLLCHDESESKLTVADQKSVNGSRLCGKELGGTAREYVPGEAIRIGDSVLRIFNAEQAVTDTVPRSSWFGIQELMHSLPLVAGLTAFVAGVVILISWALSASEYKLSQFVETSSGLLASILIWALLFGLVSKIVKGSSQFRVHWALICVGLLVSYLLQLTLDVLLFNLQEAQIGALLNSVVQGLLSALLIFAGLTVATYLTTRTKAIISSALVLVSLLLVHSQTLLQDERKQWSASTPSEKAILPPAFMLRDRISVDEFLDESEALFEFGD